MSIHPSTQSEAPQATSVQTLVELRDVRKHFGGVVALSGISFDVRSGEIHALVGENGAGKSTLMKVLNGVYLPDHGEILVGGESQQLRSPHDAESLGLSLVPQELELFPDLSVVENLFVGRSRPRTRIGAIHYRAMERTAREKFKDLGHPIDVRRLVRHISVADQQMVTIARALVNKAKVLVMDEPTAALTEREVRRLFRVLNGLREQGVGIVYISHRMDEIDELADRVTVIRDGAHVFTRPASEVTQTEIIQAMVGRPISQRYTRETARLGDVRLHVKGLERRTEFHNISLSVRSGEVVGLSGLVGAGRTELAHALFGLTRPDRGTIKVLGKELSIRSPRQAQDLGIALVPEERRAQALLLPVSIARNISLPSLVQLSRFGLVNTRRETALATRMFGSLGVRGATARDKVSILSGGNQQKVVLAKALAREPKILILDEPTRGVDVGAKREIYKLIDDIATAGTAVLVISSELDELLAIADRILVMREGRLVDEFNRDSATRELLIAAAAGGVTETIPTIKTNPKKGGES